MNSLNNKNQLKQAADLDRTAAAATQKIPLPVQKSQEPANHIPERYIVKASGDERALLCLEAPNINVHIDAGLSVSGSVVRKSPSGTIFLDGVAQCEPLMDHERQVYNLDHHERCVRAFTLATCEQALVMYMKGLDLQSREWNIFANEPDLDTILAIWIILNHARIGQQDTMQRRLLFSLIRYEGIIDALGLELKELSALPPDLMRKIQRVIDHLRSEEIVLKKEGRWSKTDYLTYTASILHKIDQLFFKASDFADYKGIEELARIDLTDQRIAAVVEADMGIYEIEPHLNKLYGNRLGVVFLRKGNNSYTVRQIDLFMPITLEEIYERLNFVDPAVKCRTQTNKWGGANDIGGSPRETGTELSPLEIARTCRDAVRKPGFAKQTYRFVLTAAMSGFILLCAWLVYMTWNPQQWFGIGPSHAFWTRADFGFMFTILLASAVYLIREANCFPWQFGWIIPTGNNWWLLTPIAVGAGAAGGVWAPQLFAKSGKWLEITLIGLIGMPLSSELLFRSLVHGLLAQNARVQRDDTRWFLSWPAFGSTLQYTGYMAFVLFVIFPQDHPDPAWLPLLNLGASFVFGLAAAMVRERSQSVLPPIVFHCLAAAAAFGAARLL
jgi:hypothetical protein